MKTIKGLLISFIAMVTCHEQANAFATYITRQDSALKITNSLPRSCQNPCFSPNGNYIIYTRFMNGYNIGPAEIVKIRIDGTQEQIIVANSGADNVIVPFGSWVMNKICFASDRGGAAEEIWLVNDDGTGLTQLTNHSPVPDLYIEPVFNPQNTNKIVFEWMNGLDESLPHKIALLELDKGNLVTMLTTATFDDRLPSWSNNGTKILWQRIPIGQNQGWQIITANINVDSSTILTNITNISNNAFDNTDCSWGNNDQYVLSSSNYGGLPTPNIFAFPSSGIGTPIRKTFSDVNQDGAASISPNGNTIAFESHSGTVETETPEIYIINNPATAIEDRAFLSESIVTVYPNPFIHQTQITYTLNEKANVQIEIYNVLGGRILILPNEMQINGEHHFNFNSENLSNGIYFLQLRVNKNVSFYKIMLNK